MAGNNSEKALENITAKIERSQGKVADSFAIKSHEVSDEEIIARAKEAIKNYRDYHYSINWVEEPNRKQAGGEH